MLRSLSGTLSVTQAGPDSAQSDLDEAWEIAERGPMPLFLADIHLHRARLFGGLKSEANDAKYTWQSPAADLAAACGLIEKHGYRRRMEELADAEAAEAAASRPPEQVSPARVPIHNAGTISSDHLSRLPVSTAAVSTTRKVQSPCMAWPASGDRGDSGAAES